ncbi:hypothetical protein M3Y96_00715500 [Aphelenchoides besseyi]|nr:hypothetical protein M3Y96_00715500 [Aphelenchoides besseyi]
MEPDNVDELASKFDRILKKQKLLVDLPFRVVFKPDENNNRGPYLRSRNSTNPTPMEMARAGSSNDNQQPPRISPTEMHGGPGNYDSMAHTIYSHREAPKKPNYHSKRDHYYQPERTNQQTNGLENGRIRRASDWFNKQPFNEVLLDDVEEYRQRGRNMPSVRDKTEIRRRLRAARVHYKKTLVNCCEQMEKVRQLEAEELVVYPRRSIYVSS